MVSIDVNVLVYAHRQESPDHDRFRTWLEDTANAPEPFALSELVLSAFVRVVTNHRVFPEITPLDRAITEMSRLRELPNAVVIAPGRRHWGLFVELCLKAGARGNIVPDAYLAALAIEHGCEWITTDRDYARFAGLRWRHPLD